MSSVNVTACCGSMMEGDATTDTLVALTRTYVDALVTVTQNYLKLGRNLMQPSFLHANIEKYHATIGL